MKAGIAFLWSSPAKKLEQLCWYLLVLFFPTQFGKHFWPDFSYVVGQRVDYLSPTIYVTDILIAVLFLLTLWRRRIHIHPYFLFTILFLSIAIFLSESPLVGWYFFLKFLEMSFLVWYVSKNLITKEITGLLFFLGIVFESILSLGQIFHQGAIGGLLYFLGERNFSASTPGIANASVSGALVLRPYGTFSHPNMLAGYFVVAMLFVTYLLGKKKSKLSVFLFFSLAFGTVGLAISLSRTEIFAWIAAGILAVGISFHQRISKNILLLFTVVGATLLLSVAFFPVIISRLLSFSFGESLSERIDLAKSAITMILSHPLLGVGPNNFISSLPIFAKNDFVLQPVHTIYLLIAAESGIVGLLIFLGFLLFVIKVLHKTWGKNSQERSMLLPLSLALFVILFSGFFDHYFFTLQQGQLLFALCIGFIFHEASSTS